MNEEWRDIKGYEGKYQVSNLGEVRSLDHHQTGNIVVMKPGRSRGYPCVTLSKDNKGRTLRLHVLVAEAFIRPRIAGEVVMHLDSDKENNKLDNLRIGTSSENRRQMFDEGFMAPRGERAGASKLTESQVQIIKQLFKTLNDCEIARRFDVSQATIWYIRHNRTWKHVTI